MTTTAGDPLLELEYPRAFAEAFMSTMVEDKNKFRYLHLSGGMVERDQSRALWIKSSMRKIKVCSLSQAVRNPSGRKVLTLVQGQGELQMVDFAKTYEGWETIIARPGMVVQRGSLAGETSMMIAGSSGSFIRFDELAVALIDAVVHGSEELLSPLRLLQRGQELVREASKNQT
jgi:hypothetical protein